MRLDVTVTLDSPLTVPQNYHQILQAAIYSVSSKGNPEYTKWLHDEGVKYGKRTYKLFTFSLIEGDYTEELGRLTYRGDIKFSISSVYDDWIKELNTVLLEDGIQFGKKKYTSIKTELVDVFTMKNEILVETLSPIMAHRTDLHTKAMQFFAPDEEEFVELINDNYKRKYVTLCGEDATSDMLIAIADGSTPIEYATRYKRTPMTGWLGKFKLYGNPKALTMILNVGIGSKNAQGFGMIKEVEE